MTFTLISGSSRGLGRGIASYLRDNGEKVLTNSRHLSSEVNSSDHFVFDCRNRDQVSTAILKISKTCEIRNLICVVGSGSIRHQESRLQWSENFEANFFSAVILFEETVKQFPNLKNVVFISSIAGGIVMKDPPIEYSVAKSALNHYARLLALTYAPKGLLINVIAPGNLLFEGSVWDKRLSSSPESTMAYIKKEVPLGRFVEIDSIASTVQFLIRDNRSITGQIISVDGGQSI